MAKIKFKILSPICHLNSKLPTWNRDQWGANRGQHLGWSQGENGTRSGGQRGGTRGQRSGMRGPKDGIRDQWGWDKRLEGWDYGSQEWDQGSQGRD